MSFLGYRCVPQCLILIIILGGTLALCPMATATEATTTENLSAPLKSLPGPLGLAVSGASAGINTEYFEQAVADAIVASGIFSGIDNSKTPEVVIPMIRANGVFSSIDIDSNTPYLLNIRVIEVDAPSFSIRMTVTMNVVWSLNRTADNATLLHEVIYSTYTGGAFEGGVIGASRVRAGTEGAVRENIRIGMEMLTSLDLE